MTPNRHKHAGLVAGLAITAALAAGHPAQAMPTDLRTEHAAAQAEAVSPKPQQDQRSPDAREAPRRSGGEQRSVPIVPATDPVAAPAGFQWDDAAIGAGSSLGLLLLLAGATAAVTRRHRASAARPAAF